MRTSTTCLKSSLDPFLSKSLNVPKVWGTLQILDTPVSNISFNLVPRAQAESEQAQKIRLANWDAALQAKLEQISQVNPAKKFIIQFHDQTQQNALFEKTHEGALVPKMWDGNTISTIQTELIKAGENFSLEIFPIKYSEWTGCTDPKYCELNPSPCGIGVSVMIETTDGFVVLTRRGIETPVYPARLYSPGGGPKPGESTASSLLAEIFEETGLIPNLHFNPNQMLMLAYVSDLEHQGSTRQRPELIAYLPLSVDSNVVRDIRDADIAKKKLPENDVWALEFISSRIEDMMSHIILKGPEMCPPIEAGLAHLVRYKLNQRKPNVADSEVRRFMERVTGFQRLPFAPPIQAMSRLF